jgi:hypothetical protein
MSGQSSNRPKKGSHTSIEIDLIEKKPFTKLKVIFNHFVRGLIIFNSIAGLFYSTGTFIKGKLICGITITKPCSFLLTNPKLYTH